MGVYTLKELEKMLPSVAGIHAMQVKESIQNLTDDYQVRVEKIGSGNWYWSFNSDSKKAAENRLGNLKAEEGKLVAGIKELESQIERELKLREEGEEEGGVSRKELLETHERLLREKGELDTGLAQYCDNDPEEVLRKVEETKRLKASTLVITDNIEALGDMVGTLTATRAEKDQTMAQVCGDEYMPGEGLKELLM